MTKLVKSTLPTATPRHSFRRIRPRWQALTAVVLLAALIAGCLPQNSAVNPAPAQSSGPQSKKIVIALALPTLSGDFYQAMQDGAQEAANRLKVQLVVMDANNNINTQMSQVKELISQKVSAILLDPIDSLRMRSTVEMAAAANIPVLAVNNTQTGNVLTRIGSDNLAGGKIAANYIAQSIRRKGNVVELTGQRNTAVTDERASGFSEAMRNYPNVKIIAVVAVHDQSPLETFTRVLEAQPQIDAVFAHTDEILMGALQAAKTARRAEAMVFVGFDGLQDTVKAIEAGEVTATVAQQPAEMGRLGVETAVDYLNKKVPAVFIPVDLALITR